MDYKKESKFNARSPKKKSYNSSKEYIHFLDRECFETENDYRFVNFFYGTGWRKRSYKEIGEEFGVATTRADTIMRKWVAKDYCTKKNNLYKPDLYLPSKGRNCKVQGKNYYQVNKQIFKEKLDKAVKKSKKLNGCQKTLESQVNGIAFYILNFGEGVLNNLNKLRKSKPRGRELPLRGVSFKKESSKGRIDYLASEVLAQYSRTQPLRKLKAQKKATRLEDYPRKTEKFRAIQKIFTTFGFKRMLEKAYDGTICQLLKISLKYIEKLLKLMRWKIHHGWKLRSFWGFFLSEKRRLPQTNNFANPYFKMRAKEFRDAIDGKKSRMTEGVDTNIVVQGISHLEKKTGEKVSEKTLERFMYHRTQNFKAAIEAICYRMGLDRAKLPDENQGGEENSTRSKGMPILKQMKINKEGKPYTQEDHLANKPFKIINKIVGYEPIEKTDEPKRDKLPKKKNHAKSIKSWIGLAFYALKLGSPEVICDHFFKKRNRFA